MGVKAVGSPGRTLAPKGAPGVELLSLEGPGGWGGFWGGPATVAGDSPGAGGPPAFLGVGVPGVGGWGGFRVSRALSVSW